MKIFLKIPPMMTFFLRFPLYTKTPVTGQILTRNNHRLRTRIPDPIKFKIQQKTSVANLKNLLLLLFLLMVFLLKHLLILRLFEQILFPKNSVSRIKFFSTTSLLLFNFLSHSKALLRMLLKNFPLFLIWEKDTKIFVRLD